MKKVLIISYYFPPAGGPGSQRVVKFVKYLSQFGWQPLVLTVENGEFPFLDHSLENDIPPATKIYRTKSWEPFQLYKKLTGRKQSETLPVGLITRTEKGIREKIFTWIRVNMFVPDARIGWIKSATNKAFEIIEKNAIDIIFSSSPPHSLQLIAKNLKERTRIPWVADFRDPWTEIRYYQFTNRTRYAFDKDTRLEAEVLGKADAIISVSQSLTENFKALSQNTNISRFDVISNGYDPTDFLELKYKADSNFKIVHIGNLLAHQNPKALWMGLQNLVTNYSELKTEVKVQFLGGVHENIIQAAKQLGLEELIEKLDFIPHNEALSVMKSAELLLVVIPDVNNNQGIVTGKIFEYIGSGRPILLIGPENCDAAKIISQIPNGTRCTYTDSEKCTQLLIQMIKDWRHSRLSESPLEVRTPFSRLNLTRKLVEIFNSLSE
jgi:glycosyltransferase involved in cell wall biosynthesis